MTPKKLAEMLATIPEPLQDCELEIFSTWNGQKFSIREDVSQFNLKGKKIQIYVKETT